jgi:hypothetical protein
MMAALPATASAQFSFRTIDGSFNNLIDTTIGRANTPLLRRTTVSYGDGLTTPGGGTRPSARLISNAVCAQAGPMPNAAGVSDMVWQWGQFLDHDLDLSPEASPSEGFSIPVPTGDPFFDPGATGTVVIGLNRSTWSLDGIGVRHQTNIISAWIDASNVYGSDLPRAIELRTMDGTGRLKTSAGDLLPFNVNGFDNGGGTSPTLFLAGDVRANEQNGLTAMHTLFVREHNFIADFFGTFFPFLPGDTRYDLARMIVGAEMQRITYEEFLPVILGPNGLAPYAGYDPNVNGAIENFFSTASYRFGHTMLSSTLLRLDSNLNTIGAGDILLRDAFFAPDEIVNHGIEPLLRGLTVQAAQEIDPFIVDDVRNFLFGPPGSGGFDLASLNLQRGRDHGMPSYNLARLNYGLVPVTSFAQISSNTTIARSLMTTYGSLSDIDPWVGGLAEDQVSGALVGPLVHAVLKDQFRRLRDGDRLWHQLTLPLPFQNFVNAQTLGTIIKRNTTIGNEIPDDVFHVPAP